MSADDKDLEKNRERLELALKASNEGVWDWNLESGEVYYSSRVLRFFGYGNISPPNIFADPEEHVHPSDVARFQRKLERLRQRDSRFLAIEPRIKTASGEWRWFRVRALPIFDQKSGRLVRLVGSVIDISIRKRAEEALKEEQERMQLLFENIPVNVYFKDKDSRFRRANQATAKRLRVSSVTEMIGKTDADFFDDEHAEAARQEELEIMATGKGKAERLQKETWEDGRQSWVLVTKQPWRGPEGEIRGTFGMTNDVTELMEAKKRTEELTAELAATNLEIERERHLLRMVIDNIPLYVYFKDRESKFVLVNQWMAELFEVNSPKELLGKKDSEFFGREHGEAAMADELRVMETEQPMVAQLEKIRWDDGRVTHSLTSKFPWYDNEQQVIGIFGVSADVTDLVETRERLEVVTKSLQEKDKEINKELRLARQVQQAALPKRIEPVRGFGKVGRFDYRMEAVGELSGDLFEVFHLPGEGKAGVFFCDVTGTGVRAALMVNTMRAFVERAKHLAMDPSAFMGAINDSLCQLLARTTLRTSGSATFLLIDLEKKELSISVADHPGPLLMTGRGGAPRPDLPEAVTPALGKNPKFDFPTETVLLKDVDGFCCYSDGALELMNTEGEEFGLDRVRKVLTNGQCLAANLDQLFEEMRAFAWNGEFSDDACVLSCDFSEVAS